MSDDPAHPVIAPDRLDHYTTQPGDLVRSVSTWNLSYEEDGYTLPVLNITHLKKYLYDTEPNKDIYDSMGEWIEKLTPSMSADMPSQLRDELLDAGYVLPQ